jgi:hypothetical protein
MSRVYAPLKADHPLVVDGDTCPICHLPFHAGERTTLLVAQLPDAGHASTIAAAPAHATCAFRGYRHHSGRIIRRIKDGDGSPYPVVLEHGSDATLAEVGLDD